MKRLSTLVLMLLLTTSFSYTQSNEKKDVKLLAKDEIRISSAKTIVKDDESLNCPLAIFYNLKCYNTKK